MCYNDTEGENQMKSYLQKAYCMNQTVRIYAAITTDLANEAMSIHHLWPTSAAALSRVLTIAAIMSCTYKAGEYLNINIRGNGPVCPITVEATDGKVRGFVHNPGVYLKDRSGKIVVKDGVGNDGLIEVIKYLHLREPFSSTSQLISGEIAEDFTYYFAQSEQIPSAVGLGESFNSDASIRACGGFLIQIMPGCSDESITKLEQKLKNLKSCAKMIEEGYTAIDIIREITDGDYQLLETKELSYCCPCSKSRFRNSLKLLGQEELKDILKTDHHASITCQFCGSHYEFDETELTEMLNELKAN